MATFVATCSHISTGYFSNNTPNYWAAMRAGPATFHDFDIVAGLRSNGSSWTEMVRGYAHFDTSSVPTGATIVSAYVAMYPWGGTNNPSGYPYYIVASTVAGLVLNEYSSFGTTLLSNAAYPVRFTMTRFTLNSSGLAAITKGGTTKLGVRIGVDANDYEPTMNPGSWESIGVWWAYNYTFPPPQLVVTYTFGDDTVTPTALAPGYTIPAPSATETAATAPASIALSIPSPLPLVTTTGGTHWISPSVLTASPALAAVTLSGVGHAVDPAAATATVASGMEVTLKPHLSSPLYVYAPTLEGKSLDNGMAVTLLLRQAGHDPVDLTLASRVEAKVYDEDNNLALTQILDTEEEGKTSGRAIFVFYTNDYSSAGRHKLIVRILWRDGTYAYLPSKGSLSFYVAESQVT